MVFGEELTELSGFTFFDGIWIEKIHEHITYGYEAIFHVTERERNENGTNTDRSRTELERN